MSIYSWPYSEINNKNPQPIVNMSKQNCKTYQKMQTSEEKKFNFSFSIEFLLSEKKNTFSQHRCNKINLAGEGAKANKKHVKVGAEDFAPRAFGRSGTISPERPNACAADLTDGACLAIGCFTCLKYIFFWLFEKWKHLHSLTQ